MRSADGRFALEVLYEGQPLREYYSQGETFVEGPVGVEYALRVWNFSGRHALAVLSVDGLSIVTGQRASQDDPGYVLVNRDSVEIPGWRLGYRDVAHFYFATLPEAYASQMDKPENTGVIGAIFFLEKQSHFLSRGPSRETPRGCPETLRGDTKTLGGVCTGFGRRTDFETDIHFEREDYRAAVLTLHYDSAQNLIENHGLTLEGYQIHQGRVYRAKRPKPFPADNPGCPPPSN